MRHHGFFLQNDVTVDCFCVGMWFGRFRAPDTRIEARGLVY